MSLRLLIIVIRQRGEMLMVGRGVVQDHPDPPLCPPSPGSGIVSDEVVVLILLLPIPS